LVDEARHKGQKVCPMESIAHDRKFMIAASTCSVGSASRHTKRVF